MNKPTIQEQIDWCRELRDGHTEWLEKMGDINGQDSLPAIANSEHVVSIMKSIMENLVTLRNISYAMKSESNAELEVDRILKEEEVKRSLKRLNLYINKETGVWHLLPYLHITIETTLNRKVLGIEVAWLKRWYAVEIDLWR